MRSAKIELKRKPEISRVVGNKNQRRTSTDEAVVVEYPPCPPKHHVVAKETRDQCSIVKL
jgi:hypothetical protein